MTYRLTNITESAPALDRATDRAMKIVNHMTKLGKADDPRVHAARKHLEDKNPALLEMVDRINA